MSEGQAGRRFWLVYAAAAFALGAWWVSGELLGPGLGWMVIGVWSLAIWHVRGRPGQDPWWARSVSWADVRTRFGHGRSAEAPPAP